MSIPPDQYAFEKFGQRNLSFQFNRRQFFRSFLTEYEVSAGRMQGGIAYKLSALSDLSDEQLAQAIPLIVPDCTISVTDGFVWGCPPSEKQPIKLFPLDSPALTAFNLFNGLTPLHLAAESLAQAMEWDASRAFAFVRGLFLYLVSLKLCIPK